MAAQAPIVCDNGTGYLKVGRASSSFPEFVVPSVLGRPHESFAELVDSSIDLSAEFIGAEIETHRAALRLVYPMEEGIVNDWDAMEKIWAFTFQKFPVDLGLTPLLLTEAPQNPLTNRQKMAEIMFEKFGFPALDFQIQAILGLYAMGYVTGLVVDSGDGVTHCIPVNEGQLQKRSISRMNIAGRHLTNFMTKLLLKRGYNFHGTGDFEVVREIKEKVCFASLNYAADVKLASETTALEESYQLPDKSWVKIGKERFEAAEALFNPGLVGNDFSGLSEMIFKSIMNCDMSLRKSLFEGIILSGGTTMIPGISSRIKSDLKQFHLKLRGGAGGSSVKVRVEDPPYRKNLVYIGGATLANINSRIPENWVYKFNWEEEGPRCVHK